LEGKDIPRNNRGNKASFVPPFPLFSLLERGDRNRGNRKRERFLVALAESPSHKCLGSLQEGDPPVRGPPQGASGLIEMEYEILKLSYEEFT
jgi:hypothetical protein